MSQTGDGSRMSEGRALLTDREREALAGDDTDNYRYKTRTYFRRRLEKLERDVAHLAENEPDLLDELREVVCREPGEREGAGEPAVSTSSGGGVHESRDHPEPTDEPEAGGSEAATPDVVERVAEGWEDPPERLEARKAAARGVLEYAREHGGVSKQEAKEEVFPEYPVEGQNPRTWYRKNIRPVLNEAAEYNQSTRQYELTLGV